MPSYMPLIESMVTPTLGLLGGAESFLLFMVGISAVIFLHELGHFAVAKMVGIRVDQFAIGFGQALVAFRKGIGLRIGTTEPAYCKRLIEHINGKLEADPDYRTRFAAQSSIEPVPIQSMEALAKVDPQLLEEAANELGLGETEYRFNYIPLGGYVKMLGQEDLDPTKQSSHPRAYNRKPIWARMCVISAGVIMNVITAVPMFMVAFMIGVDFPPAVVGDVMPGSPAAQATVAGRPEIVGLRAGDVVTEINGEPVSDFAEIRVAVALSRGKPIDLTVQRPAWNDQPAETLSFTLQAKSDDGLLSVGVASASQSSIASTQGLSASDAERLTELIAEKGLTPGVRLAKINGEPATEHWQYTLALQESGGSVVPVTFVDDAGSETTLDVEASSSYARRAMATVPDEPDAKEDVPHLAGLVPPVVLEQVVENSPAHGKLEAGDIVVKAGEFDWPTFAQMQHAISSGSGAVDFAVLRDGERVETSIEPRRKHWGVLGKRLAGVVMSFDQDHTMVADVLPDTPFAALGLQPGTTIKAINDQPVSSYRDIRLALESSSGEVSIRVIEPTLGGTEATHTLALSDEKRDAMAALGWNDPIGYFEQRKDPVKADSPTAALSMGMDRTALFLKQTYVTLVALADQTISPKHLSGPVGIAHIGTRFANDGVAYLLFFMGLISVNLAVINFLPLPIVDGGHMVMLILEKLRGKPLPMQVQSAVMVAGLVLLGGVFLFVTYNDIVRLIYG